MHLGIAVYEPLLIYIGAIVAFFLSVLWKPQIGFYYLVPFLPMQTVRYWLHGYPLGEKLVDILLLGVLIGLFVHVKRPIFVSSSLGKVVIAFMVLTYVSLWQGAFYLGGDWPISFLDPRFSDWKNYVEMMSLFFVAAAVIRTPKQMGIVIVLMTLSVLMVNRSYHNLVGSRDFSQYSDSLRDAGALGYAGENGMGAFQAEFALFLIAMAAFAKRRGVKLALWALAFTSVYCLVFSFSRGGYLGFLVGLLVIGLVKERKLLLVLAIFLVSWEGIVPNGVRERVLMTYQEGQGLDASAEERVSLWQDALQVIHQEPLLGTGFDTYKYMGRNVYYQDTHNYYVKVMLELGSVGLLMFLWLLGRATVTTWRLFRSAKDPFLSSLGCACFTMIIAAMVVNCFGDRWSFLQVNAFLWILLGLVARGLALLKEQNDLTELTENETTASPSALTIPEVAQTWN